MPLDLGLKSIGSSQAMIFVEFFCYLATILFYFELKTFDF
jgi:hypothetical protein